MALIGVGHLVGLAVGIDQDRGQAIRRILGPGSGVLRPGRGCDQRRAAQQKGNQIAAAIRNVMCQGSKSRVLVFAVGFRGYRWLAMGQTCGPLGSWPQDAAWLRWRAS